MIVMTIEFIIESLGHVMIGPVSRLDEALAVAAGNSFDCAIVDVNIQGGLTYAVADLLIARNLPFLLATGYAEWSLPAKLRDWPRLVKPYSEAALSAQLEQLVGRIVPAQ